MKLRSLLRKGKARLKVELTSGSLESRILAHLRFTSSGMSIEELHKKLGGDEMKIYFALHRFFLDCRVKCDKGLNVTKYRIK